MSMTAATAFALITVVSNLNAPLDSLPALKQAIDEKGVTYKHYYQITLYNTKNECTKILSGMQKNLGQMNQQQKERADQYEIPLIKKFTLLSHCDQGVDIGKLVVAHRNAADADEKMNE